MTTRHWLLQHAEDVALVLGVALVGIGTGLEYGLGFGLMTVGTLAVAYGVWITERRH